MGRSYRNGCNCHRREAAGDPAWPEGTSISLSQTLRRGGRSVEGLCAAGFEMCVSSHGRLPNTRLSLAPNSLSTCFPDDWNRSSLEKITGAFLSCRMSDIV